MGVRSGEREEEDERERERETWNEVGLLGRAEDEPSRKQHISPRAMAHRDQQSDIRAWRPSVDASVYVYTYYLYPMLMDAEEEASDEEK